MIISSKAYWLETQIRGGEEEGRGVKERTKSEGDREVNKGNVENN